MPAHLPTLSIGTNPRSRDVKVLAEPLVSRRYALTCRNRDTCYALSSSAAF